MCFLVTPLLLKKLNGQFDATAKIVYFSAYEDASRIETDQFELDRIS